jgi:hypothetical protein
MKKKHEQTTDSTATVLLDTGPVTYLGGLGMAPGMYVNGSEARVLVTTEGLYVYDASAKSAWTGHRKPYRLVASIALSEVASVEAEELYADHARGFSVTGALFLGLVGGFIGSGRRVGQTTFVVIVLKNGDQIVLSARAPVAFVKNSLRIVSAHLAST